MSLVWVDGDLREGADATIPALSTGLLTGTGVFESMLILRGEGFALRRHLRRLRTSAKIVDVAVPFDDDALRAACNDVIAGSPDATKLRVTLFAGGAGSAASSVVVHAERTPTWAPTSRVVVSPWVRNERSPSSGAKTISYVDNVLAMRHARRLGADEAVMCDTRGNLSEGTASNVFVVVDGTLSTPSEANGCAAGMTRELVGELVDVDVRADLSIADLRGAEEAFVTSSTRGVHPIASVDGTPLAGVPGPLTRAAATALDALQAQTTDP